jgi:hypothetical protein
MSSSKRFAAFRVRDVLLATNTILRNLSKVQEQPPYQLRSGFDRSRAAELRANAVAFGPQALAFIAKQAIIRQRGIEMHRSAIKSIWS